MKIKNKLLVVILFLALIPAIAISLALFITTEDILKEQIEKAHYEAVTAVDTVIFVVVGDMVNIAFTATPKIADLIEEGDYEAIREKLRLIDKINMPPPDGTGRGVGYHIVVVTDKYGYVLARSDVAIIEGEIVETGVEQIGLWRLPKFEPALEIAFSNALRGETDARKIIYSEKFIRREGYGFLIDKYGYRNIMGLTAHLPIFDEQGDKIGVIAIITILNNNHVAIGAINAITGAEFTAITPRGEIMASFFVDPFIPTPEIIEKAKMRADEMRRGIKEPAGKDSVFYTKERIYLKPCPGKVVFRDGVGRCYIDGEVFPSEELDKVPYRLHLIAEVDPNFNYVSIRGIAYELTKHDLLITAQRERFGIVFILTFLMIGGLSLVVAKKGTAPIVKFTKAIQKIEKEKRFGEKIDIGTGDEIEILGEAFNGMSKTIVQSYQELEEQKDVLEIKVASRTRQLQELSDNLEEQVGKKTKNLKEKIGELEKFQDLTVDRELKMVELKKEIKKLKEETEEYKKF